MQERLIISALVGGDTEKMDRGALAQKIDEALRTLLGQFNLALTSTVGVEDDILADAFEDKDTVAEVPFSFDGTIAPD